jgi:tyrosine-protein kinase Etk/Wzc
MSMEKSFSLLDLFLIFLRQKGRIAAHFAAILVVSVVVSYLIPKNYKATTLFLPPQSETSGFPGISLGLSLNIGRESAFTPQQIETLLDSRKILEATIKRFDLIKVYKTAKAPNKTEKAIKMLRQHVSVTTTTEPGLAQRTVIHYALSAVDKDRQRAADIANYMVDELARTMDALSKNQFRYSELFIRGRLDSVVNEKGVVYRELAEFQKKYKVYSPEMKDQVLASIDVYAELHKQKMVAEMEKEMLLFDRNKNSREVRFAQKKIDEINAKMNDIEKGTRPDVLPGLNYSVEIAYKYLDLVQEAEVLTKLELLLRQQYEEARIRAARLSPTVRVVDRAVAPEWKNSPKKAYVVLVMVGLYMLGLVVSILVSHGMGRASEGTREKIREFRNAMRIGSGRRR